MSFLDQIKKHSIEYGSLPFWSWNDKLEPERLKAQIRDMHDLGMNGFFMHARGGLETEYLSEEWYRCIEECVKEAKKLGMEAWSYDENGWPSGFAGGKLLQDPKNFAAFLKYEKKSFFDKDAFAVYVIESGKSRRVTEDEGEKEYITVKRGYDSSYVDTLDGDITDKFLAVTHEEYKARLGDDFGKSMPGFFTDEPQYYRGNTVWSDTLPEKFRAKYGYDVFSALDALFLDFDGACDFRYDYWRLCHELFIENFIKRVYDWCEKNGCRLTGHAVEETLLSAQMWCCGGVMPFYEYEHIPGIDHLCRDIGDGISPKQLGSACAQLGKKKALSEMFACCGWDVSPLELKKIADYQYVAGVNLMCQHLYPYSERGQRKRDYPAHYSQHLPWQKEMKAFDEYYNRLGYTLSQGDEIAPVLMIHPIHSVWLDYKRIPDYGSVEKYEKSFLSLTRLLFDRHIGFHYGDEELIAKYGSVENGILNVGKCHYDTVVMPLVDTLDRTTVVLLKEFIRQGGKVLLTDGKPTRIDGHVAFEELAFIETNITLDEIVSKEEVQISAVVPGLEIMSRNTDRGRIAFVTNLSPNEVKDIQVSFRKASHLNILDLEKNAFYKTETEKVGDFLSTNISLESGQSVLITEFEGEDEKASVSVGEPLSDFSSFAAVGIPENAMTLDHAELSFNGIDFEKSRPVELIRDILYRNRYKGDLWLRFSFDIKEIPSCLSLAFEPMNLLTLSFNGTEIKPDGKGWFDPAFLTAKITHLLKIGRNDFTVKLHYWQRDYVYYVLYGGVSESLRNCLVFDTEIENVYLFGDFTVDTSKGTFVPDTHNSLVYNGSFTVSARKPEMPVTMKNIVTEGYPFFAGSMTFQGEVDYKGNNATELFLNGRFAIAKVSVNGQEAGTMMFRHHLNLAGYLKPGKNLISVTLFNSNRNLMGPHHRPDPEPFAVGPNTFSYEKEWREESCPFYLERYAFVQFGASPDQIS